MKVPRFDKFTATTLPDQIGKPELVILGLDMHGEMWVKQGDTPWRKISRAVEQQERSTGAAAPDKSPKPPE